MCPVRSVTYVSGRSPLAYQLCLHACFAGMVLCAFSNVIRAFG